MNHDFLIKTTNKVAFWAVIALMYWIFIFIVITVFDLKIFREHITETFFMSVLGIFALLGGAMVLNVMSNLSKISSSVSTQSEPMRLGKKSWWLFSFPVIFALLFGGNLLSANNKEKMLVQSALSVIAQNPSYNQQFAEYTFDETYIKNTAKALQVVQKIDKHFPQVLVIQRDLIDQKSVFLSFNYYYAGSEDDKTKDFNKQDFIFSTGKDERTYLTSVFAGKTSAYLFNNKQGNYELFYPVSVGNKRYVMYFSDYQRYGKIGS
jgi:hypothetical protein